MTSPRDEVAMSPVEQFVSDPAAFFGMSLTAMESISRAELEALQLQGIQLRLQERREQIPMLAKLADGQGIRELSEFNDIVPLLFEHTTYKSYPASFLAKNRFADLTRWLDKLTPYDLASVDVSSCDSIDSWLWRLCDTTELDPLTSSGTTGTMSFVPRDRIDWYNKYRTLKVMLLQEFGEPPDPADADPKMHVIWPTFGDGRCTIFRAGQYFKKYFAHDDEAFYHPLYPMAASTDLMYLAARLRLAGSSQQIDVPPHLLARRDEMERMQQEMSQRVEPFLEELVQTLDGERVIGSGTSHLYYDVATKGLANGTECRFGPDSLFLMGGGAKGVALAPDWEDVCRRFYGKIVVGYSMTELTHMCVLCDKRRFHVPPWIVPFVLDPDTSEPLPRTGVQKGRAAYFDLMINGLWGGLITGDEIEIDFESGCACGRTSVHLSETIERFSDKQDGGDKITCAATPQAHAAALDFLVAS